MSRSRITQVVAAYSELGMAPLGSNRRRRDARAPSEKRETWLVTKQ